MRVCHLDTCPVGVATQNPELRAALHRQAGVRRQTFFEFIAEEVREHLAAARLPHASRRPSATPSCSTRRGRRALEGVRARPRRRSCTCPTLPDGAPAAQHHRAGPRPGQGARQRAASRSRADALERRRAGARSTLPVRNVNRTVGTMLGHEVTKRYGGDGLPDDTIDVTFTGSAGQSFGAFLPRGITLRLEGDANDYVGKGLSGGRIVVRPDRARHASPPSENIIAGNVIGYGATARRDLPARRRRRAVRVRNSGATAVVEGVGDHGCEYMTGGTRRRPRADRPQLRGRHVRRHRLRARPRPRAGSTASWSTSSPSDADDARRPARRWSRGTTRRPARTVAAGAARRLGRRARPASPRSCPRDYQRVLERRRSRRASRARRQRDLRRDHGGGPWLTPRASSTTRARDARPAARSTCGCMDWHEVYEPQAPRPPSQAQAGRCMDCGIPFCHNGCPLGNLIPEWNDLVWRERLGRRHRAAARDQQLPGVHRPALPGAVRDRLRARHQRRPGDDQAGRGRDHRPGLGRRPGHARSRRRGSPARRSPSSAPARPVSPPPSSSPAPGTPSPSTSGPTGSADCCATASPSSRWRSGTSTAGWTRWRPRARRSAPASTSASTSPARSCATATTRSCSPSAPTAAARPAGARPRARRRPPGDGVPAAGQPGAGGRPSTAADRRRRASTSSSSAAATPAPTASAPRIRQGAASVTQLEILPRPPEERPAGQPWPTYPMIFRVSSAHEEGGERVFAVEHPGVPRRRRAARLRALRAGRGRARWTAGSSRSPAPSASSRPTWCCSPWASPGPSSATACSTSSASSSTRAATSRRDDELHDQRADGVFVAGDAGRGQSLIVWAIAEGRSVRRGVDALPRPVDRATPARARSAPTARPLGRLSGASDRPVRCRTVRDVPIAQSG